MKLATKTLAFNVYNNDGDLVAGCSSVTMPGIEYLTETYSGAGILGEIDDPALGIVKSLTVGLKYTDFYTDNIALVEPKAQTITIRGAKQVNSGDTHDSSVVGFNLTFKGKPKTSALGSLETGKAASNDVTYEVTYLKLVINGNTIVEIDKYNWTVNINGTDYTAAIKSALGV